MKLIIQDGNPAKKALLLEIWKRCGNYIQTRDILARSYGIQISIHKEY